MCAGVSVCTSEGGEAGRRRVLSGRFMLTRATLCRIITVSVTGTSQGVFIGEPLSAHTDATLKPDHESLLQIRFKKDLRNIQSA